MTKDSKLNKQNYLANYFYGKSYSELSPKSKSLVNTQLGGVISKKKKNWGKITNINKYRKLKNLNGKKYTAVVYDDGGYYELTDSYGSKNKAESGIDNYKKRFPRMMNKQYKIIESKDFKKYGVSTNR